MSKEKEVEVKTEQPETKVVEQAVVGTVVDCLLLNVRETPAFDGVVKTMIGNLDKVTITETESTDEYYSITTKEGVTGFCKKSFIKL